MNKMLDGDNGSQETLTLEAQLGALRRRLDAIEADRAATERIHDKERSEARNAVSDLTELVIDTRGTLQSSLDEAKTFVGKLKEHYQEEVARARHDGDERVEKLLSEASSVARLEAKSVAETARQQLASELAEVKAEAGRLAVDALHNEEIHKSQLASPHCSEGK